MRHLNACLAMLAVSLILTSAKYATAAEPVGNSSTAIETLSDDNPAQKKSVPRKNQEITGTTSRELIDQILAISKNGSLIIKWDITWGYKVQGTPDSCFLDNIGASATILQPALRLTWVDNELATDKLRAKWKRYLKALQDHNQGHADIANLAAKAVKAALNEIKTENCDKLRKDADAKAKEVVEEYRQKDAEYDRLTDNDTLHIGADPYILE